MRTAAWGHHHHVQHGHFEFFARPFFDMAHPIPGKAHDDSMDNSLLILPPVKIYFSVNDLSNEDPRYTLEFLCRLPPSMEYFIRIACSTNRVPSPSLNSNISLATATSIKMVLESGFLQIVVSELSCSLLNISSVLVSVAIN
jgi:hypothetical protein